MADRRQIISQLKKYFDVRELVCNHTYDKFGKDRSWQFLDTEILETILILRTQILKKGMVCNNYHNGGIYTQRGLRCNICQIPKDKTYSNQIYLSAHCNGAGFDFTVMDMTAEEARTKIKNMSGLLPYPVRIEKDVNWLHIDCFDALNGLKVTEFNG